MLNIGLITFKQSGLRSRQRVQLFVAEFIFLSNLTDFSSRQKSLVDKLLDSSSQQEHKC